MPASLYPTSNPASLSLGNLDLIMMESSSSSSNNTLSSSNSASASSAFDHHHDSRAAAEQIALQLALLQQQGHHESASGPVNSGHNAVNGHGHHGGNLNGLHINSSSFSPSDLLNGHGASGSLEDLKSTQRRSQNMTECVPVPSSEHVAEIVGRQGCKIKALRAKTNTYIKTPVRGEEPVFVVTGRKEDVALAKREILSAADHFSQIRASRKSNINSTLAFGQLMANTPGQTTVQVRVPYRVVGLVVGPKGATIKRIQQQTHTYIVTPSRDKEPVFEVTGLPENVEAARKEIEAHIAIRTGTTDFGGMPGSSSNSNGATGGSSNGGASGNGLYFNLNDNMGSNGDNDLFSTSGGLNSPFSSSSGNLDHVNSILNSDSNGLAGFKSNGGGSNGHHAQHPGGGSGITLANLLSSEGNFGDIGSSSARSVAWSNGTDSHDSGIGHSPPFDNGLGSSGGSSAFKNFMPNSSSSSTSNHHHDPTLNGIWGELNKVLGGLDLNGANNGGGHDHVHNGMTATENKFLSIGSRSSLDLGTLGRPLTSNDVAPVVSANNSTSLINTANNSSSSSANMGRQMSLPCNSDSASTASSSTPSTLPGFNGILSSSSTNNLESYETKDERLEAATASN